MITQRTDILRNLPPFIYKIAAQSYIDKEFPRHVFIETTASCQLSCAYCPREKRNDHMEWSLFKEIVDECSHYGPRSFSFHLFGEPLLYPKIIEAIRYVKAKNSRNTALLTTNGVLLNRFARELDKIRVDRVIWSYRKNNFNQDSLRLLRKKGLVRLLIEETPKEEFEKWSKFPRVEVKSLHNYGGNIDVTRWNISDASIPKRYPCYHLWLAPAIRWNGEIVECCNIPKAGQEVLGTYGKNTLSEVWRANGIHKLRESHLKGIYPGACNNCTSWQAYPNIFFKSQCQTA